MCLDEFVRLVISGVVTLGTAFAGAFFAFRFQKRQQDTERQDTEVASGNLALFTLTQIWKALVQYQKEIINPHRDRNDVWLNMAASPPIADESLRFDAKGLSFVLQAEPATFQQVFLEADRFKLAVYLIDERNRLMRSEVFPRMSAAGLRVGQPVFLDRIEGILGISLVHELTVISTGIINHVDEDVASVRAAFEKLRAALKKLYPKRKFLNFPTPVANGN